MFWKVPSHCNAHHITHTHTRDAQSTQYSICIFIFNYACTEFGSFGGGLMTRSLSTCFHFFSSSCFRRLNFQWCTVPSSLTNSICFRTRHTTHSILLCGRHTIWLMTSSFWYCFRFAALYARYATQRMYCIYYLQYGRNGCCWFFVMTRSISIFSHFE